MSLACCCLGFCFDFCPFVYISVGFLGNSQFVLPAHTCSALLWSCSRTADSGRIVATNNNGVERWSRCLSWGYNHNNNATGHDLFCLLPPKATTYHDKSGWWAKDVLSYTFNPFSSPFAHPSSFIFHTVIAEKNFREPLFYKAFNQSEVKAFSSKSLYLNNEM